MTNYYEVPFAPQIGTGIRGLLFEPLSPLQAATLEKVVSQVIESYEPRVRLVSVLANPQYDSNSYSITISFYVVGVTDKQSIQAELKRLR